ncbi:hypothetical protein HYV79_04390 [Candidatus Woesearchaeota archaeon]|nr:hypothetical protein [Candidatus Woesearchaeota archaeon]
MKKIKRRLSEHEEFELMKLVLDKFLWLAVGLAVFGLWRVLKGAFIEGAVLVGGGILFMLLFTWIIVKEFEAMR